MRFWDARSPFADVASGLRDGWRSLDAVGRAAVLVFAVICAVPPVTNYSPGGSGYGLVLAALVVGGYVLSGHWTLPKRLGRLEVVAGLLCLWLALSTLWGDGEYIFRAVPVAMTALCAVVPWAVMRSTTSHRADLLGWVCAGGTLGTLVAAFPMTWLFHPRLVVIRPGLPIGGASNNAVGLLILLAGTLMMARADSRCRAFWLALAALDVVMIAQSFSRVGWALLLIFVVLAAPRSSKWRAAASGAAAAVLVAMGLLQYWFRGEHALTDGVRWNAASSALGTWSASVWTLMFGAGQSGVWQWMAEEVAWSSKGEPGSFLRVSDHGLNLYHAHSTYLAILVEQGVLGFSILLVVLMLVGVTAMRAANSKGRVRLVALALLLSFPAMLVELYLLRSFPSAFLWWFVVWVLIDAEAGRRKGVDGW